MGKRTTYTLGTLDARVARRLTDTGPDFLIGFGVSWRH